MSHFFSFFWNYNSRTLAQTVETVNRNVFLFYGWTSSRRGVSFPRGTGVLNLALSETAGSKLSARLRNGRAATSLSTASLYEPGLLGPKLEVCQLNSLYKIVVLQVGDLSFISPQGSFNFTRIFSGKMIPFSDWCLSPLGICLLFARVPVLPSLLCLIHD